MTTINELMRLATDLCVAQMKTSAEYVDAYETLKSALEAALKPGEPVAYVGGERRGWTYLQGHEKLAHGTPLYTAPPAQPDALKPGVDLCEKICHAIKAADEKSMREADYMLDSDDCIRIVKEFFAAAPPAQTPVEYCQSCGDVATRPLPDEATSFPGSYCDRCGQDTTAPQHKHQNRRHMNKFTPLSGQSNLTWKIQVQHGNSSLQNVNTGYSQHIA
jgi:hypothetical protein